MEEARALIFRLDLIEAMERSGESAQRILDQLALLAVEAERWLERERSPGRAARRALDGYLGALARLPQLHRSTDTGSIRSSIG